MTSIVSSPQGALTPSPIVQGISQLNTKAVIFIKPKRREKNKHREKKKA